MFKLERHIVWSLLIGVATALVAGGVALASAADEGASPARASERTSQAVPSEIAQRVGLFRRAQVAEDIQRGREDSAIELVNGARRDLSRRVDTGDGGPVVYVAPARAGLCLSAATPQGALAVACGPGTNLDKDGYMSYLTDGSTNVLVFGVVPDGVESVTVTTTSGAAKKFGVRENVYSFAVDDPASLVWHGADGERHQLDVQAEEPPGPGNAMP